MRLVDTLPHLMHAERERPDQRKKQAGRPRGAGGDTGCERAGGF